MGLTLLERNDPRRADALRADAVQMLRLYPTKKLADVGGVGARRARQERAGDVAAILARFLVWFGSLVEAGLAVFPIVARVQSLALQSIIGMEDIKLVARWYELMDREAEREGAENRITSTFCRTGDLIGLADALESEAAVELELAATSRELKKRKIDPREECWIKALRLEPAKH